MVNSKQSLISEASKTNLTARLIAINAAQLGIALISNLSLLLNMARRVRFEIAQPITIIGWYVLEFKIIPLFTDILLGISPRFLSSH